MPRNRLREQLRTFLIHSKDDLYRHQLAEGFQIVWDYSHGKYFDPKQWEQVARAWVARDDIKPLWQSFQEDMHPLGQRFQNGAT